VLVWIVAILAAAGGVAGLVVALGGHGELPRRIPALSATAPTATPAPSTTSSSPAPLTAPTFDFRVAKSAPVRGSSHTRVKVVRTRTRRAVRSIRVALTRMYRLAFLVPAAWQHDRYGPIYRFFAGDARASARSHTRLLTLGPDASRLFDRVVSAHGTLNVQVLLDRGGHPFTAVARADFRARAARTGGGTTMLRSIGSYFLRPSSHGWLIFGFQVHRKDRPKR